MDYHGQFTSHTSARIAIVVSRFNERVTQHLLKGAKDSLIRHGVLNGAIDTYWVPGAFEIAPTARRIAKDGGYEAIITLGAVVRGDTPHFDYVAGNAAAKIADLAYHSDIPVIFGVLTTDTMDQAEDRAGGKAGNKGSDAAMAALEMIDLFDHMPH